MPQMLYGKVDNHLKVARDLHGAYIWGEQLRGAELLLNEDLYGWLQYVPRLYRKKLLRELNLPGP